MHGALHVLPMACSALRTHDCPGCPPPGVLLPAELDVDFDTHVLSGHVAVRCRALSPPDRRPQGLLLRAACHGWLAVLPT